MSKSSLAVFNAWKNGMCIGFDHIRTGGQRILVNRIPLLVRTNGAVIMNVRKVGGKGAVMFARRQREISSLLQRSGIPFRNSVSGL